MSKIEIPLAGRTFERTQGCWNCVHRATPEESLAHWLTNCRPANDAAIASAKLAVAGGNADPAAVIRFRTPVNAPCPCGSGQKYKRCHRQADEVASSVFKKLEYLEKASAHLEMFEQSIRVGDKNLGHQGLCLNKRAPQDGGFKAHNFMCDQWTGAQGASVARGGQRADDLPEEMMDKHGDGN